MATEQQIEANKGNNILDKSHGQVICQIYCYRNKANARHSTGPRTAAGNALKHGMRAQQTVLPGENSRQFQVIVAALVKQFKPATEIEWTLLR